MRQLASLSSQEINDITRLVYSYYISVIGVESPSYSGIYDKIQTSGIYLLENVSGIPTITDNEDISFSHNSITVENWLNSNIIYKIPNKWSGR